MSLPEVTKMEPMGDLPCFASDDRKIGACDFEPLDNEKPLLTSNQQGLRLQGAWR